MTAEAVVRAFPAPEQTGEEAAGVLADLLLLARDWDAGRMPIRVVAELTTPKERYSARRAQPVDGSDEHRLLCRLFDALVQDGSAVVTKHGVFLMSEWRDWRRWREAAEPHLAPGRYVARR